MSWKVQTSYSCNDRQDLPGGNLSSHASKLEAAGYIKVEKEFVGKKPHTMLHLTMDGQEAFQRYRKSMKQVFDELPE